MRQGQTVFTKFAPYDRHKEGKKRYSIIETKDKSYITYSDDTSLLRGQAEKLFTNEAKLLGGKLSSVRTMG